MFGFSYESLDIIGRWAMIGGIGFGVLALILTAISSVALYTSGKNFQREAAIFQREATERIAVLNNETAQARLETERLKRQIAGRRLTETQFQTIVDNLTGLNLELILSAIATDPESMLFATDIQRALAAAGIKHHMQPQIPFSSRPVVGIIISGPKDNVTRVGQAFTSAGFNVTGEERQGDIEILIGSKPPPQ